MRCFLLSAGVKKGDRVGLFSPNRPEWWVADLAILSIGAADVPIYATNSAEESRYILSNSGSNICIVGTEDHLKRILEAKKKLPGLKTIIVIDNVKSSNKSVITLADAMKKGNPTKTRATWTRG